jgi:spermidine synthase
MNRTLFAIGAVTLLGQVVLLRELLVAFFGSELISVLALGLWLLGSALGALWGGRRGAGGSPTQPALAWLLIVLGLLLPLDVVAIRGIRPLGGVVPGAYLELPVQLGVLAAAVLPPSLLAGALLRRAAVQAVTRGGHLIRAYAVESAGGMLGGVVSTALMRYGWANLDGVLLAGLLATAAGAMLAARTRRAVAFGVGAAAAATLAAALLAAPALDHRLAIWGQPDLAASRDTPYGRITVTAAAGQTALFEDGALVATSEDTAAEEFAHLAAVQRGRPDSVLVLGFGSGGEVAELLAYRPTVVDWVVVDAELVRWLAPRLPGALGRALAAPAVRLIEADPRAWLTRSGRYDLILSTQAAPQSGRANRFWTREFFAAAGRHLRPGGVFACRLAAAENVWTPARLRRAAGIHRALAEAMADVVALPGFYAHIFLASDAPLSREPRVLAAVLAEAKPPPRYLTGAYLEYLYSSERFETAAALLAAADVPANRDVYPACYATTQTIWLAHFLPGLAWRDGSPDGVDARSVGLLLALIAVAVLAARRHDLGRRCVAAAVAGAGGMILEAVLLLHYQVHHGVLYQELGLLFTAFMAGLACGGEVSARMRPPGRRHQVALAASLALLSGTTAWLTAHGAATGLVGTTGLLLLAGAVTAALLGVASRRGRPAEAPLAGPLIAADLLGGSLGSVAVAVALVPLWGLPGAAVSGAALAGAVLLVT